LRKLKTRTALSFLIIMLSGLGDAEDWLESQLDPQDEDERKEDEDEDGGE